MTHPMYISRCHGVTPTSMSSLFIVRVLLGQQSDNSSDVYKWLPWSNFILRHRYGYNGETFHFYVIAINRTCLYCIQTLSSNNHAMFTFA